MASGAKRRRGTRCVSVLFSEPKIPQFPPSGCSRLSAICRFSALQRAENSSMGSGQSSKSYGVIGFSALQRAENSSILRRVIASVTASTVSVLFSEPKIPQFRSRPDERRSN